MTLTSAAFRTGARRTAPKGQSSSCPCRLVTFDSLFMPIFSHLKWEAFGVWVLEEETCLFHYSSQSVSRLHTKPPGGPGAVAVHSPGQQQSPASSLSTNKLTCNNGKPIFLLLFPHKTVDSVRTRVLSLHTC